MDLLRGNSLEWLLEPSMPAVRALALRDLVGVPSAEVLAARHEAHQVAPIAFILSKMNPEGYWDQPGPGYSHKYHSTVWSILSLAQIGAHIDEDERIQTACRYVLENTLTRTGQFTASGAPSYTFDCLQGNLCWALTELGCRDGRLDQAFEWMIRTVNGAGIAPAYEKNASVRFYAIKCGPGFACGINGSLPCAWGAVKVLRALATIPAEKCTSRVKEAIQTGVDFLLSTDPATADYPTAPGHGISQNWWRFGFPVYYISDILQVLETLCLLGYASDPRLAHAVELLLSKQDEQGRWNLEYSYSGKAWGNFGTIHRPNKWVTLRALRVLKAVA
jgi:hypothetical protein